MNMKRPYELIFGYDNDRTDDKLKTKKYMKKSKKLIDNYYWFNDSKNSDVIKLIENENTNTNKIIKKEQSNINNIYNNILKLNNKTNTTFKNKIFEKSNYVYYLKTQYDDNKCIETHIHMRMNVTTQKETIIFNEHEISQNNNTQCEDVTISRDEQYCAYGIDTTGDELYELKILNIETQKYIPINIPKLSQCNYCWSSKCNDIYYLIADKMRFYQLWYYNFDKKTNKLLFEQNDKNFSLELLKSCNDRYIIINNSSNELCESHYIDLENSHTKLTKIISHLKCNTYMIEFYKDSIIIIENNKIFIIKQNVKINDKNKKKIKFYSKNISIANIKIFSEHMAIEYIENGNNKYDIYNFKTKKIKNIQFNSNIYNVYESNIDLNCIYNTNILYISIESLIMPLKIYKYDMDTMKNNICYELNINNYDSNDYTTYTKIIKSSDNADIHIIISHLKNLNIKIPQQMFMTGYGAYGLNVQQYFEYDKIEMLNNNIIYVIVNTRGSSYLGTKYYEKGKLLNKKNTFNDFIDCAEYLINNKYTTSDKLTIYGESAGGLLTSVCLTQRPELFKNVICKVPFVDVMTTMSDTNIPLTIDEFGEWGNPNIKKYYEYMLSYCPYNNIKTNIYPNILIIAGYNDSRVKYHESLKFITKIREFKTDDNLQLLKINMNDGHFTHNFYEKYKEKAFIHSFINMNIIK